MHKFYEEPEKNLPPFVPFFIAVLIWLVIVVAVAHSCAKAEMIDINAIIQIESSGNPYAVSKDNCIGLMQISEAVRQEYNYNKTPSQMMSKHDLFCPAYNVGIGVWYINIRISQLLRTYHLPDTVENRLIAYHDGIGNLVKYRQGKRNLGPAMKGYLKKYAKLTKG